MSVSDIACSLSLYNLDFLSVSLGVSVPNCTGEFDKLSNEGEYACYLKAIDPIFRFLQRKPNNSAGFVKKNVVFMRVPFQVINYGQSKVLSASSFSTLGPRLSCPGDLVG